MKGGGILSDATGFLCLYMTLFLEKLIFFQWFATKCIFSFMIPKTSDKSALTKYFDRVDYKSLFFLQKYE